MSSLRDLSGSDVRRIAIGDPKRHRSENSLRQVLKNRSDSHLNSRYVYAEHSGAVLNLVAAGEAEVGLVYRTDAVKNKNVHIVAKVPAETYSPDRVRLGYRVDIQESTAGSPFRRIHAVVQDPRNFEILRLRTSRIRRQYPAAAGETPCNDCLQQESFKACVHGSCCWLRGARDEHRRVRHQGGYPGTADRRRGLNGLNSQRIMLTPTEVATLLRGVRVWEDRNVIHRLVNGDAQRTRAFRDNEIRFLAPAISNTLAQAGPSDRIYFHLGHATESGEEETRSGWLYLRDPLLYLLLSEAHDRHGPGPDISKYDRRMPDIPEQSGFFKVTFKPKQYVEGVSSRGGWFSADQRQELRIYYRQALHILPTHPLDGGTR